MVTIDYQDPLILSVLIKANLQQDRPNALLAITSNPGKKEDHYISLVQRVYSDKNDLTSFKGYVTYRFNEVRNSPKTRYLPEFSSIELRKPGFTSYDPPVKIHFHPKKVGTAAPSRYLAAGAATASHCAPNTPQEERDAYFAQWIGEDALKEVYDRVLDLIDGNI